MEKVPRGGGGGCQTILLAIDMLSWSLRSNRESNLILKRPHDRHQIKFNNLQK